MKVFYKIENGNRIFYDGKNIILNDWRISNPTEEQLLQAGWIEYTPEVIDDPTETELLQAAKNIKLQEIEAYNDSSDVNGFFVNDVELWVPADKRAILRISINAYKALNIPTITKIWEGAEYTFSTEAWDLYLNQVEVYASECLNVTLRHAAAVQQLTDIQAVEDYDYTTGYPNKLYFTMV